MTATEIVMIIRLVRLVADLLKGKDVSKETVQIVAENAGLKAISGDDVGFLVDVLKAIGKKDESETK